VITRPDVRADSRQGAQFAFVDDAAQPRPSRAGMGPLVATGGIVVPASSVGDLERAIDSVCGAYGFPTGQPFKWSPSRDMWMYASLTGDRRRDFFLAALRLVRKGGGIAVVVICDKTCSPATDAESPELDVTQMLLERVHNQVGSPRAPGFVVVATPPGDRTAETHFLKNCLETVRQGTRYATLDRIALVLSTPAKLSQLLQVADVVTSCTLAAIAGEAKYAPPLFEEIRGLLRSELGRIGGTGLKIHPDGRYANLYHWLLGDTVLVRYPSGFPLPAASLPYASAPDSF
jgi:hypothetical protein